MSDKVYPAFARVLGGQKPTIRVRDMTSRWGVCYMKRRQIAFALQLYEYAARTDLCGGARVLPLPAAQPQPGLLGQGEKLFRTGKNGGLLK